MLPDGRRLGAHLPLVPGMVKAVDRAHAIGASALQVFGDNPTAWRRRATPPAELPALLEQFDAREILHVTFGSVLTAQGAGGKRRFYPRLMELLRAHAEAYAANLERHFCRHLTPFAPYAKAG